MENNPNNTNPVNRPTPEDGQSGQQPVAAEPAAQTMPDNPAARTADVPPAPSNNNPPVNNYQHTGFNDGQVSPTGQPNAPAPADNYVGLTGSQIQTEKQKLPTGVFVIAGFMLVGFLASLFDTSQNSGIYSVILFIDLLLAGGLLLRYEIARKIIVWLSIITIVLTIIGVFMQIALQQRIAELKNDYDISISKIDQNRLSVAEKVQLEKLKIDIAEREKQAGKAIMLTYVKFGLSLLASGAAVVYLTRPKVKEVFHELEA